MPLATLWYHLSVPHRLRRRARYEPQRLLKGTLSQCEETIRTAVPKLTQPRPMAREPPSSDGLGYLHGLEWLTAEVYVKALQVQVRTYREVPADVVQEFARIKAEVAAATQDPARAAEAHRLADLLNVMLLVAPTRERAGKKRKQERSRANIVKNRISLLREGNGIALLKYARSLGTKLRKQGRVQRNEAAEKAVLLDEILRLCSLQELRRAAGLMGSQGIAKGDAHTVEQMKSKLSSSARVPVAAPAPPSGALRAAMVETLSTHLGPAVRTAPKGSAAGYSGDRFEYWQTTYAASDGGEWAAIVEMMADRALGLAPPEVTARWRVVQGFALLKKKGSLDIRPIAAHEPGRRAVARALAAASVAAISEELTPAQCGVGVPGGAESLGLAARNFAESHPDWVVLKLDMSNAYGNVCREDALLALEKIETEAGKQPLLAYFQRVMLQGASVFVYNSDGGPVLIEAEDGVEQGDPAAPAMFCVSFAGALAQMRARIELLEQVAGAQVFVGAYIDDVVLIVPSDAACEALAIASEEAEGAHQSVHPGKSKACSVQGGKVDGLPCEWAERGMSIAGVPIPCAGSLVIISEAAAEVVERARADSQILLDLCVEGAAGRARVESAKRLLINCVRPRMDFLSRVGEPQAICDAANELDDIIYHTYTGIYGLDKEQLQPLTVAQIHDTIARGGEGVAVLVPRLGHNFVDGALSAAPYIAKATGRPLMQSGVERTPYEEAVHRAVEGILEQGAHEQPSWGERAQGRAKELRSWGARIYAEARQEKFMQDQVERAANDIQSAARVASAGGPGAAWRSAPAAIGGACTLPAPGPRLEGPEISRIEVDALQMPDASARASVRFRLGLCERSGKCRRKTTDPKAKKKWCDCVNAYAQHLVTCPCGPWAIDRHNALARLFQLLVLEIPGASVRWTQKTAHWPQGGGEPGEPDLRIDIPGMRTLYVDVAITFPSSRSPGAAAAAMERLKELAYPTWCNLTCVAPMDFAPLVFESFGRCGKGTRRLIHDLATRSANDRGVAPKTEVKRWMELLSVRLQLDQANILING